MAKLGRSHDPSQRRTAAQTWSTEPIEAVQLNEADLDEDPDVEPEEAVLEIPANIGFAWGVYEKRLRDRLHAIDGIRCSSQGQE